MDVHVHPRLACRFADVHADVVAVGRMPRVDRPVRLIEQCENRRLFLGGHVEEIRDMTFRHDEDVSAAK